MMHLAVLHPHTAFAPALHLVVRAGLIARCNVCNNPPKGCWHLCLSAREKLAPAPA